MIKGSFLRVYVLFYNKNSETSRRLIFWNQKKFAYLDKVKVKADEDEGIRDLGNYEVVPTIKMFKFKDAEVEQFQETTKC